MLGDVATSLRQTLRLLEQDGAHAQPIAAFAALEAGREEAPGFLQSTWQAKDPRGRAAYVSETLRQLAEPPQPQSAPPLCPPRDLAAQARRPCAPGGGGGGRVEVLSQVQLAPSKLVRPGGLRRSVWVLPTGYGKTMAMIEVIANFLEASTPWQVFVVGDEDIFVSFDKDLRKTPTRLAAPSGPSEVRLRNPAAGNSGFCALAGKSNPIGRPLRCESLEHRLEQGPHWLSYLQFGNLLQMRYGKYEKSGIDPFGDDCVWILDEGHKLLDPYGERTTARWRESYLQVGSIMSRLNPDEPGPIIALFTATPGDVVCMANMMKGLGREAYLPPSGGVGEAPWKKFRQKLEGSRIVDPKSFFGKDVGLVEPVTRLEVRLPWNGDERQVDTAGLVEILSKNGGPTKETKLQGKKEVIDNFPCRLGASSMGPARLIPAKSENLNRLITLLSGLFFWIDGMRDSRFYPRMWRWVRPTAPAEPKKLEAQIRENLGKAGWNELSNFARPDWLLKYVQRRLAGGKHTDKDEEVFQESAPKWHALRGDLLERRLRRVVRYMHPEGTVEEQAVAGKVAVYLGAGDVGDCSSTVFALGLAFYLCAGDSPWSPGFLEERDELLLLPKGKFSSDEKTKVGPDVLVGGADFCKRPAVFLVADPLDAEAEKKIGKDKHKNIKVFGAETFRTAQLNTFNEVAPPGEYFKIMILDKGAKKALNLLHTNVVARMVALNDVDDQQTLGRAMRACSFAGAKLQDWQVHVVDYRIVSGQPWTRPWNLDAFLDSWYCAEGRLSRETLRLATRLTLGCKRFGTLSTSGRPYPRRCKDEAGRYEGCLLESDADEEQEELRRAGESGKLVRLVMTGEGLVPARAFSGDISDESLDSTKTRFCKTSPSLCTAPRLAVPVPARPAARPAGEYRVPAASASSSSAAGSAGLPPRIPAPKEFTPGPMGRLPKEFIPGPKDMPSRLPKEFIPGPKDLAGYRPRPAPPSPPPAPPPLEPPPKRARFFGVYGDPSESYTFSQLRRLESALPSFLRPKPKP